MGRSQRKQKQGTRYHLGKGVRNREKSIMAGAPLHGACRVALRFSRSARNLVRRLRTSTSGAPIRDVTNSMPTWCSMVDGMAGVALVRLACAWMECCKRLCTAQRCLPMPWAAAMSSTAAPAVGMVSAWLCAAAFAIVSSDTTAHASCFGAGLLRIALCSASNVCCWSLSLCA